MSRISAVRDIVCRPARAGNNGFPMDELVRQRMRQIAGGIPGDGDATLTTPQSYYHRVNYPTAGSTQFRFFNEPRARGITNLDTPNQFPANYGFLLRSISFDFLPAFDRQGAHCSATVANSSLSLSAIAAATADQLARPWRWNEKVRELMSQGVVTFKVGQRDIFEVFGLTNFPSGKGVVSNPGVSNMLDTSAAANSLGTMMNQVTNGAPVFCNRWEFYEPFPIAPNQTFELTVDYLTAVSFSEAGRGPMEGDAGATAGVLMCEMLGQLVIPAAQG